MTPPGTNQKRVVIRRSRAPGETGVHFLESGHLSIPFYEYTIILKTISLLWKLFFHPGIPTPIFTFPLGAEEAPVPPPRYSGVLPRRVADSSDPCPAFLLTCLLPVLKPPGSGKERDYECSIQDTAWPSLSEKSFQGVGWRVLRCSASSQLHQKALRKAPSWVRHRALSHSPTLTPRYPYPIPWGNRLGMVSYCWGD